MLQNSHLTDEAAECYEQHRRAKSRPSLLEYTTLLQSAVGYFSKVILIIDALDECPQETRDLMMEEIRSLQPGMCLLVTSRHTLSIMPGRLPDIIVKLKANDADIRKYLEERVSKSRMLKTQIAKDIGLHDFLVTSIVGKARGM